MEAFVNKPFDYAREEMVCACSRLYTRIYSPVGLQRKGTSVPCYVTMLLEDAESETKDRTVDSQREADIKWTANSLYAASIDTVSLEPIRTPF